MSKTKYVRGSVSQPRANTMHGMGHGNIAAEVRKDASQRNTLECLVPCGDAGKTQPAALA